MWGAANFHKFSHLHGKPKTTLEAARPAAWDVSETAWGGNLLSKRNRQREWKQDSQQQAQPWARTTWHLAALTARGAPPREYVSAGAHKLRIVLKPHADQEDLVVLPLAPVPAYSKPRVAWNYLARIFFMPLRPVPPSVSRVGFLSFSLEEGGTDAGTAREKYTGH